MEISIAELDRSDESFRFSEGEPSAELVRSLAASGQREPIDVIAAHPGYRVIDGFGRIGALESLERTSVRAVVHEFETDHEALRLSFQRNVASRNLPPVQRASAIQLARRRGVTLQEIADDFGLSVKQIRRYLALLRLPAPLAELVESREISMAHGRVLAEAGATDIDAWVERCQRLRWSAEKLREELAAASDGAQSGDELVSRDGDVLRLRGFTLRTDASEQERNRVRAALEQAIQFLERVPPQ